MDAVLCDELLEEVFRLLPPSSSPSLSLVSRRWLRLLRSSTLSLSLRLLPSAALPPILAHYPNLVSLSISSSAAAGTLPADGVLLAVAAARLRFLTSLRLVAVDAAVSPSTLAAPALNSLAAGLTALHLTAVRPLSFRWLAGFPRLKSLFLLNNTSPSVATAAMDAAADDEDVPVPLPIKQLALCGITAADDRALGWLWRRCGNLRWLQLRGCGDGSFDDGVSVDAFAQCLPGLLTLELRACRAVADRVLLLAAEFCGALTSLLVHDGGGHDALRQFIHRRGGALRTLDLRLPLDLHNDHLLTLAAAAQHCPPGLGISGLTTFQLQSCCLVTGDGLRALARAPAGASVEELALVSCDVVEREPGLLTFLGQSMRRLRRLDLSYNETLTDKEFAAMLASCTSLTGIKLSGCRSLTGASVASLVKHCGRSLESVDVTRCPGIGPDNIELLISEAGQLNQLAVEGGKVTPAATAAAQRKGIRLI